LFFNPSSFEEQERMLKNSFKVKNLGMIVLDTFNMFYRLSLENDGLCNVRSLNRQIANLQVEARKKNFYAIIVGQVYSVDNDDVKPFSGMGVEHVAKTILKFNKAGPGKRKATIIKHRSQPECKTTFFKITKDGLE
jgi:DNA repair protein RadB